MCHICRTVIKRYISFFLLLIVVLQFLPVKDLGQAIFKSPITEESTEQFPLSKDGDEKQTKKNDEIGPQDPYNSYVKKNDKKMHFVQNTGYFSRNLDDIPTPPPLFRF